MHHPHDRFLLMAPNSVFITWYDDSRLELTIQETLPAEYKHLRDGLLQQISLVECNDELERVERSREGSLSGSGSLRLPTLFLGFLLGPSSRYSDARRGRAERRG